MKCKEFKELISGFPDDYIVLYKDEQNRTYNLKIEINTSVKSVVIQKT